MNEVRSMAAAFTARSREHASRCNSREQSLGQEVNRLTAQVNLGAETVEDVTDELALSEETVCARFLAPSAGVGVGMRCRPKL